MMRIAYLLILSQFVLLLPLAGQTVFDRHMEQGRQARQNGNFLEALGFFRLARVEAEADDTEQRLDYLESVNVEVQATDRAWSTFIRQSILDKQDLAVRIDSLEASLQETVDSLINQQVEAEKNALLAVKEGTIAEALGLALRSDMLRRERDYLNALVASLMSMRIADEVSRPNALRAFYTTVRDSFTWSVEVPNGDSISRFFDLGPDQGALLVGQEDMYYLNRPFRRGQLTSLPGQVQLFDQNQGPNGTRIITTDARNRYLLVWELNGNATEVSSIPLSGRAVITARFSPEGNHLAYILEDDTAIELWNVEEQRAIRRVDLPEEARGIFNLIYGPNEALLIRSGNAYAAISMNARDWISIQQPADVYLHLLSYSGSDQRIVTASAVGNIRLYDVSGAEIDFFSEGNTSVKEVHYLPEEKRLISRSISNQLLLWELQNNQPVRLEHDTLTLGFRYDAANRQLFSWSSDGALLRWSNLGSGAAPLPYRGHQAPIVAVRMVETTTSYLASLDLYGKLVLWDREGRQLIEWPETRLRNNDFLLTTDPDGLFVRIAQEGRAIQLMPDPALLLQAFQQDADRFKKQEAALIEEFELQYLNRPRN